MSRREAKLWQCPRCKRDFANRNQTHTCAKLELSHHFANKSPAVRALFAAFVKMLSEFGPIKVLPEKTRIAFQVRMSFAQVQVRRDYLIGHFVLARRAHNPRFTRVETFSPRNHVHHFRLDKVEDIDKEFRAFAQEAYAVGEQKHLHRDA